MLSLLLALSMILTPGAAFADTAEVPMYLTVSEEPLVFDVTENIQMTATQGSTTLAIDPVTVTNNGTKKIQVSSIALNPASGWSVKASSTDFTTAAATALSFTCGSHDFASGAYAPSDAIAIGDNKTYTLEGHVSAKADLMAGAKVSDLVLTIEKAMPKIVSWTAGTDAEIVAMVAAADAGDINLADYWSVGDERKVTLSQFQVKGYFSSPVYSEYRTQDAQDVTLVLLNNGGKTIFGTGNECNFVVGFKELLCPTQYTHENAYNGNDYASIREMTIRHNCEIIYNSLPDSLRPIFKKWEIIVANGNSSTNSSGNTGTQVINDYLAAPAYKEIFGVNSSNHSDEGELLTQLAYYSAESNRIKKYNGEDMDWFLRTPNNYLNYKAGYYAYIVNKTGSASSKLTGYQNDDMYCAYSYLSPIGCI